MLAEPLLYLPTYRPDGFFLVIPVGDFVVDGNAHQIQPLSTAVHQLLQVIFAENAADFPLWGSLIVPEIHFKAVSGEYHGATAKFSLQAIRIQSRLLSPDIGVLTGTFGFYHRQR